MFEGNELQFIVRNDELNTAEDIHNFNDEYQLRNYSLTYTPSDITENALKIYTEIFDGKNDVKIKKASKLDIEDVSGNNIIYLGNCLAMWDVRKLNLPQ